MLQLPSVTRVPLVFQALSPHTLGRTSVILFFLPEGLIPEKAAVTVRHIPVVWV